MGPALDLAFDRLAFAGIMLLVVAGDVAGVLSQGQRLPQIAGTLPGRERKMLAIAAP